LLSGNTNAGTWSVVGGTTSTVSATISGDYYVTNSNSCGSATSNHILVTVNPLPTVTANNVSGCAGIPIALSGTPAGGTWSVANPYTGSSTTYTHTYTDGNGCTNTSSAATITVNPLPTVTANNVSGCIGSSIALSGSPAGGTWSVPNPYTGSSTTYTHTYTDGNGCTNTSSSATITVNPLPTVTADNASGCAGTPIALSGTPAGGTWSVPNPYIGSSTTYTHTYTDGNGCTNISSSATITVNPLPTVTASNVSGCAGNPITLTGSPAGGTWSVPNPYTGSSTTYTHTYTDGNGCTNTSSSATITVNPLPSVSFSGLASSYAVAAPPVTLTGAPSGGTFSGPGISGNTFTPSSAGIGGPYTITYSYTDGNGCGNTSSQQTAVTGCVAPTQPGPISSSGSPKVCPGDTRVYSIIVVSGATSYAWTPPVGGVITTGQGTVQITINYTSAFTASGTLSVAASNACGTSPLRTLAVTRNNRCHGALVPVIYPNPAYDGVDVSFFSDNESAYSIRLVDLVGNALSSQNGVSINGENVKHINLSGVKSGIYFLELINGTEKSTEKVVIEK
jgi:protein-tyrosine-phosphatase